MPDFRFTPKLGGDNPPPTVCAFCNTHACDEGFVDLLVQFIPWGRVYACARCVWTASRLVGCIDPQQVEKKDLAFHELSTVNEQLHADLELANASKVVSLEDALTLAGRKR